MTRLDMAALAALGRSETQTEEKNNVKPIEPTDTQAEQENISNSIVQIAIESLHSFPNQPFKPYGEDRLSELVDSIREHGIYEPLKVRPLGDNGYQIISGHNRVAAGKKLGLCDLPCIVKNLNDDQAKIELIETNLLHRSDFVASEKAKAYRIRADTLSTTSCRTTLQIAQDSTEGQRQIQRYIRLSYLNDNLLELVDSGKLTMVAGVELSYITPNEQQIVHDFFYGKNRSIDHTTAKAIKELGQGVKITSETLQAAFGDKKSAAPIGNLTIKYAKIKKILPPEVTQKELETLIVELLTKHFEKEVHDGLTTAQ